MARKRFSPEQIIVKLREAEVLESKGLTQVEAAKKLGIAEQTLIRWRKEYGGLRVDQARRFKELEKENIRLKQLVADLSLDKAILKDATCKPGTTSRNGRERHGILWCIRAESVSSSGPVPGDAEV